jgi:putative Mg2+ transporter-C (MgtC) family protein
MFSQLWHNFDQHVDLAAFVSESVLRLVLAAFLGGIIGLEREIHRKPAGLRTNLFICFGAALYTILSFRYSEGTLDHNRISAQIIPGIGFIGAGAILRDKGSVTGLTTAATLFVVAAIGMAVGGGEYLPAIFATMVILVALSVLGWVEHRFSFKPELMNYEITCADAEKLFSEVNHTLEEMHLMMNTVEMNAVEGRSRVKFSVMARRREHLALAERLRKSHALERVEMMRSPENE